LNQSVLPEERSGPGLDETAWRLELTRALQTTLDVEVLLELFSARLQRLVPHQAMSFRSDDGELTVEIGSDAEHAVVRELQVEGRPLGSLRFARREPCSQAERDLLDATLTHLVHPLRNALLYRAALRAAAHDPLTGVANRATLRATLDREVDLARRHGSPLAVLMVDADHFKPINDEHGHLVGDEVLRALARTLADCIRDSDMLYRYGGEEFCIVLSNTSAEGARQLAERVRAAVEGMVIRVGELRLRLTISIGAATLGYEESPDSLLSRADSAVYEAKHRGRNQVACAPAKERVGAALE
jgi:diguanylate cyclase (GGDEF)-like protein